MVPKVIHIPASSSAYTERWVGGWLTYSKEPKPIGSLVRASFFKVDAAGATMVPAPVLSHRRRELTRFGLDKSLGRIPRVEYRLLTL